MTTEAEAATWQARFTRYLETHWTLKDPAHDLHHLHRVWKMCREIMISELKPVDEVALVAACYFHDFVSLPKNDPDRHLSSAMSAEIAAALLATDFTDYPREKIPAVRHAIHAHSFTAGVEPETIEAAILQDADRMEALGAIGLARLFYTAGKMGSQLFDPEDPTAARRAADDRQFALDHIEVKLLRLPGQLKTSAGRRMAEERARFLQDFRSQLLREISG